MYMIWSNGGMYGVVDIITKRDIVSNSELGISSYISYTVYLRLKYTMQ